MSQAVTTPTQNKSLQVFLSDDKMKSRLNEVLGDSARDFTAAVLSLANTTPAIKECEPASVINACLTAATFKLPINSNLGFAHIIPYNMKQQDGTWKNVAQFQLGYKGIKQLCMRSGWFSRMNVVAVYPGQLKKANPLHGDYEFDFEVPAEGDPIGYAAFYRLTNGFEKTLYMNVGQIQAHAKRYSKSYAKGFGPWKDNFDGMAKKTVSKLLLNSGEAPMSIEFQKAAQMDQGVVKDVDSGEVEYADHTEVEPSQIENKPEAQASNNNEQAGGEDFDQM